MLLLPARRSWNAGMTHNETNTDLAHPAPSLVHQVEIHFAAARLISTDTFSSSAVAAALFREIFAPGQLTFKEHFYVALFNRRNQLMSYSLIGVGTTDGCMVNLKEILQLAILCNASGIILCHNHPSGCTTPSENDIRITRRIIKAAELFDIRVLDHIILTAADHLSFTDEGLM